MFNLPKFFIFQILLRGILTMLLPTALCLSPASATAEYQVEKAELYFQPIEGLSQSTVRDIIKDSRGFMWFATEAGANRYDGYDVEVFRTKNKNIPHNYIRVFHNDKKGDLWIGTENGLAKLDQSTQEMTEIQKPDDLDRTNLSVISLADFGEDGLLVGTDRGLFKYEPKRSSLVRAPTWLALEDNYVRSILALDKNRFWLGMSSGYIAEVDLDAKSVRHFKIGSGTGVITGLTLSDKDELLISAWGDGIYIFQIQNGTPITYRVAEKFSQPFSASLTSKDEMMIATSKGLLNLQKKQNRWQIEKHYLKNEAVFSTYFSDQTLWVGTGTKGAFKTPQKPLIFESANIESTGRGHFAIAKNLSGEVLLDGGSEVLALDQKTFQVNETYEIKFETLRDKVGLLTNSIDLIDGHAFVSTSSGICQINIATDSCDEIKIEDREGNRIQKLFFGKVIRKRSGSYLLGMSGALLEADLIEGQGFIVRKVFELPSSEKENLIRNLVMTNEQRALIATDYGVYLLDLVTGKFTGILEGLEVSDFYYTHRGSDRGVWIATISEGLYYSDLERTQDFTNRFHLESDVLYSITAIDERFLWLGTSKGLVRIELTSGQVSRYGNWDGLIVREFNSAAKFTDSANNAIYFAGVSGFSKVNTEAVSKVDPSPPIVEILEIHSGLSEKDAIREGLLGKVEADIYPKSNYFSLAFTGIHYKNPTRNQFEYRLLGFEDSWKRVSSSERKVTYTNLNPGSYEFQVKAANPDGVWSEPKSFIINVLPNWWQEWWANLLYIAVGILILGGLVRWRTKSLQRRNERLSNAVKDRTNEISRQKDTIEDLLTRKNTVFANVSHEFRTPLTLILGPVESLLKEGRDSTAFKYLPTVKDNAERLLHLVDQLLLLAHTEHEALSSNRAPIDAVQVAESISDAFTIYAQERAIELETITPKRLLVITSSGFLEKILLNLVSNAIKYSPGGGKVSIELELHKLTLQIRVTDEGAGISANDIPRIFDRFERIVPAGKAGVSGSGIGLALVKELVESEGGNVSVQSELGHGSCFTVVLPVELPGFTEAKDISEGYDYKRQAALSLGSSEIDKVYTARETEAGRDDLQVLIIEDNPELNQYLADLLGEEYEVRQAFAGEQGLYFSEESVPDLVVCDVMMPGMNGFEVARRLRADKKTSHIPIILLTAKNDPESRLAGLREEVDDYLGKPFNAEELKQRVRNQLNIRVRLQEKYRQSLDIGSGQTIEVGPEASFLAAFRTDLSEHYVDSDFTVADMAKNLALSERQLQRKIKALTGKSPAEILRHARLEHAARLLKEGHKPSQVAHKSGFASHAYFSRAFKSEYGCAPSEYGG